MIICNKVSRGRFLLVICVWIKSRWPEGGGGHRSVGRSTLLQLLMMRMALTAIIPVGIPAVSALPAPVYSTAGAFEIPLPCLPSYHRMHWPHITISRFRKTAKWLLRHRHTNEIPYYDFMLYTNIFSLTWFNDKIQVPRLNRILTFPHQAVLRCELIGAFWSKWKMFFLILCAHVWCSLGVPNTSRTT